MRHNNIHFFYQSDSDFRPWEDNLISSEFNERMDKIEVKDKMNASWFRAKRKHNLSKCGGNDDECISNIC